MPQVIGAATRNERQPVFNALGSCLLVNIDVVSSLTCQTRHIAFQQSCGHGGLVWTRGAISVFCNPLSRARIERLIDINGEQISSISESVVASSCPKAIDVRREMTQ